jgi:hypothetical protein
MEQDCPSWRLALYNGTTVDATGIRVFLAHYRRLGAIRGVGVRRKGREPKVDLNFKRLSGQVRCKACYYTSIVATVLPSYTYATGHHFVVRSSANAKRTCHCGYVVDDSKR